MDIKISSLLNQYDKMCRFSNSLINPKTELSQVLAQCEYNRVKWRATQQKLNNAQRKIRHAETITKELYRKLSHLRHEYNQLSLQYETMTNECTRLRSVVNLIDGLVCSDASDDNSDSGSYISQEHNLETADELDNFDNKSELNHTKDLSNTFQFVQTGRLSARYDDQENFLPSFSVSTSDTSIDEETNQKIKTLPCLKVRNSRTVSCKQSSKKSAKFIHSDRSRIDVDQKYSIEIRFLSSCFKEIEKRGFQQPNIYSAKNVSQREVSKLKHIYFCVNKECINFPSIDVNVLCETVKFIIKQLPSPIISGDLWAYFVQLTESSDVREAVKQLIKSIKHLPDSNRIILSLVILHLKRITKHSVLNGLTIKTGGQIFGPLIVGYSPAPRALSPVAVELNQCFIMETLMNLPTALYLEIWKSCEHRLSSRVLCSPVASKHCCDEDVVPE